MNFRDSRLPAFLAVLFVAPLAHAQVQIESVSGYDAVASETLVLPRPGVSTSQLAAAFNCESVTPLGRAGWFRLRSRSIAASALVTATGSSGLVTASEPNYIIRATDALPNDPSMPLLWGLQNTGQTVNGQTGIPLADISAAKAWDLTTGSAGVLVGVVDSGVDYNHSDLAANIWSAPAPYSLSFNGSTLICPAGSHGFNAMKLNCDPLDDNSHGTHVAGTIGARGNNGLGVTGVNWISSIVAIKFLDSSGAGSVSDAVNAIEAAVQLKALGYNIRVLNASWAPSMYSTPLALAISDANTSDILFVAAAGNNSANNDGESPQYPASFNLPNIIAVAATDDRDQLASFSNYGAASVHLGAPGVNIYSTVIGSNYAFYNGTSMATPHVVGSAALILARCTLNTSNLRSLILSSVDPIAALSGRTITGGRLNVYRALQQCGAPPSADFQLSANPNSLTISRGNSAPSTITVQPISGFTGIVQLSASGLPNGVTAAFSPSAVTGSGTSSLALTVSAAATSGSYTITVQGVSGTLNHTASITLTIAPQPDFTIAASPAALSVAPGSTVPATITIGAVNGFTGQVGLSAQGLPSGVTASFSPSAITTAGVSTLTLSAAASTTGGVYTITVQGSSSSTSHTVPVTLTVASSPAISLTLQSPIDVGASAPLTIALPSPAPAGGLDISVTTSNAAVASVSLSTFFLPAGQSISTRARVTGISAGQAIITVSAAGYSPTTIQVQIGSQTAALTFTPSSLTLAPAATQNLTLSLSPAAPAAGLTVSLASSNPSAASVPASIAVAGNGTTAVVTVTGLSAGSATITATAANYTAGTAGVTVAAQSTLVITTASLAAGQVGQPYSQTLTASGGVKPYIWALTSGTLPSGLSINGATGLISGTPLAAASPTLGFRVTDSSSPAQTASTTLSLTINPQASGESIILPATLSLAVGADSPLLIQLSSPAPAGGLDITLSTSNPAVAGLSLSSLFLPAGQSSTTRARVSGISAGQATVTVSASGYAPASVQVQVGSQAPAALSFTPSALTLAPGATQNLTLSLSTAAPTAGLTVSLSSGSPSIATVPATVTVSGNATSAVVPVTAVAAGSAAITANAAGYSAAAASVTVASPSTLSITTAILAAGQVGQFYSQTLAATGGVKPYVWSLTGGSLPSGLSLDPATGLISGTPLAAAANVSLTFRVTDSSTSAQTATVTLGMTINPAGRR